MSEMTSTTEERYRLLVEGAQDHAMILLDTEGRITSWNSGAERIMGWAEAEVLDQPAALIFTPEDSAAGVPAREMDRATAEGKAMDLRWHLRKDGSRFYADGLMQGLRGEDGAPRGFAKILRDATADKVAEDARGRDQEALRESEEALRKSDERLRATRARLEAALSAGGIAAWDWDLATDRVVADAGLAQLFSVSPEDAARGQLRVYLQAIHPEDRPRVAEAIADAAAHRETYEAEYRVVRPDGSIRWLAARGNVTRDAGGQAVSLPGVVLDITERVERERSERFLAELAERARTLTNPDAVIADALRSVGEFLGASRCVFADIDIGADTCTVPPDYCADGTVASISGTFPISAFGPFVVSEYRAGRTAVVDDVRADPTKAPPETLEAYEAIGVSAYVAAPVMHSARLVSAIAVHSATSRRWRPEEVALIQAVVERTWLTVEVLRQQQALVREAEALREAHQRTAAILESITDASYAVDRDWRFTHVNRHAEALWGQGRGALLGRSLLEAFPQMTGSDSFAQHERAMAEREPMHFDALSPVLGRWIEVSIYPADDGGMSVFFRDIQQRKELEAERERLAEANRLLLDSTGDGIYGIDTEGRFTFLNLAAERMLGLTRGQAVGRSGHALIHHTRPDGAAYPEAECPIYHSLHSGGSVHVEDDVFWRLDGTAFPVAYSAAPILEGGTVRGAVVSFSDISERKAQEAERERLAERERNIAAQLQAALTPAVPERIPGMALAKYYEAALDEAGVGGDFYDVFPVDKGCTALVVGDLSGKGLAAASQVAMVRNMLRYALYRARTLAGAVQSLNALLAEQGLLTGFATLFVGAFDGTTGTLTYVNAGQEPALVRRAAGGVDAFPPTGPILGSFEEAAFEERVVALGPGDALAVFTDGLTEVGASRTEMLGVEGVADMLAGAVVPEEADSPQEVAEALALRLIQGVDAAAAGGVMRDDVCLLVVVVDK